MTSRYLTAMVAYLQARAGSGTRYQPLSPGEWARLLRAAQAERAAGRQQGRPRRATGPARGAGAIEGAPTADVEVSEVMAGPGPHLLFGRDRELAVLAGLVTGVAAGRGTAALIEGEPGIGKSALVRAARSVSAVRCSGAPATSWGKRCRSSRCSMACTCASRP